MTSQQGEQVRVTCREAGCSRECADARAEAAARDLIAQFLANPPTHMIRVSVHDEDIDDEEIERRIRSLCRALKRHGCREYVDAVHFFEARRHDHIAVIYDGDAADPEAHLRDVVDRVFVGLHITRYAQPREKEPPALARYLVQALKPENKRDVELPPEGFDGKRLLRRSRGYNIKRKQEQPQQVYEMPADFPYRVVDTGDQQDVVAYTFDVEAITAYGDAPSSPTHHPAGQAEPARRDPEDVVSSFVTQLVGERDSAAFELGHEERGNHALGASNELAAPVGEPGADEDLVPIGAASASARQEVPPATATSSAPIFPRERLHELHEPVRQAFARRGDPRDGSLDRFTILAVLQCYVSASDGWIVGADDAIDGLVETGVLHESAPGRFVLVAEPSKAA